MRAHLTKSVLVVLLCLTVLAVLAAGADSPEVTAEYTRALKLLRDGQASQAAEAFAGLASANSSSTNLDLFLFNLAKARYYAGDNGGAVGSFDDFLTRFPSSTYRLFAVYFKANALYRSGKLSQALRGYTDVYGSSNDARLTRLSLSAIDAAVGAHPRVTLDMTSIGEIPEARRCALIKRLAIRLLEHQRTEDARRLAELCKDETQSVASEPADTATFGSEVELAVAIPLSGELQAFGNDIYNGAVIAAEFYKTETGRRLNLTPFDTKGDPVTAARVIGDLAGSSIDAVIGPLTSEEALVASAALSCRTIPLIAPAATDAGLTLLSNGAFQLSPNLELQGVAMAEYAVRTLRADTAAIITSTSSENMAMARAFTERFTKLGGAVVATEYYRSRDREFTSYIRDIKTILMRQRTDSATYLENDGDTLQVNAAPAHVDCLFIPGSADQLRLLLSQLKFYNLQGAYLGSDGWGDDAVYGLGDDVTRQAVFGSPFLAQTDSETKLKFAAAFAARFGKQPNRLSCLGFDAVRILTQALVRGAHSRSQLVVEIARTNNYAGAAGKVTFGQFRENIELPLYRIESGQAVPLGMSPVTAGATTR